MEYPQISLKVNLFPEEGILYGEIEYSHYFSFYPWNSVLINRDFKIKEIKLGNQIVKFSTRLTYFKGIEGNYEIQEVKIPEIENKRKKLLISYWGKLTGDTGFCPYAKETINQNFSFFRWETFCFPIFGKANYEDLKKIWEIPFIYQLEVKVPKGLIVAAPGKLIKEKIEENCHKFLYAVEKPVNITGLVFSAAPYRIINFQTGTFYILSNKNNLKIKGLAKDLKEVDTFYKKHFGTHTSFKKLKVIEIPNGFGSFVPSHTNTIFLESQGFSASIDGRRWIFHEYAHIGWNAKAKKEIQRCRFFDEAFAQYLSARAIKKKYGKKVFDKLMATLKEKYLEKVDKEPQKASIPIVEYGKYEYGELSYSLGAFVLYLLNRVLGDKIFDNQIKNFLKRYKDKEANFEAFYKFFKNLKSFDSKKFFQDWIYGIRGPEKLRKGIDVDEIVKEYIK